MTKAVNALNRGEFKESFGDSVWELFDLEEADYREAVHNPMDFKTVATKVSKGGYAWVGLSAERLWFSLDFLLKLSVWWNIALAVIACPAHHRRHDARRDAWYCQLARAGQYSFDNDGWDALEADIVLIADNCETYNVGSDWEKDKDVQKVLKRAKDLRAKAAEVCAAQRLEWQESASLNVGSKTRR